jgi:hypothetical protein
MMKQIFGQGFWHLTLLIIVVFTGDLWIPESLPTDVMDSKYNVSPYYNSNIVIFLNNGTSKWMYQVWKRLFHKAPRRGL